jgi:hypothetical protein
MLNATHSGCQGKNKKGPPKTSQTNRKDIQDILKEIQ